MSVAAFRIRKAVQKWYDQTKAGIESTLPQDDSRQIAKITALNLAGVLEIIDQELELEAERHFTQSINPQIG